MHRRLVAVATALTVTAGAALGAAGVPGAGAASSAASAAAPSSPITLWAPSRVTAYRYGSTAWTDLGVRLVAQGEPFELWSTRASYSDPIRTEWRSSAGSLALPEGTMTDFSGLPNFLQLTIRDRAGDVVLQLSRKACLNSWSTQRVSPDAPARSPYPLDCPWGPLPVGSVQGVQTGWASPLLQEGGLRLGLGRYAVTAAIGPRYAARIGVAPEDRQRSFTLVVRQGGDEGFRPARQPARPIARPAAQEPTQPSAGAAVGPMPDLRSIPAFGIQVSPNGQYLQFAANTWNAGDSPLVVDGFRSADEDSMDAYQYFFDSDGNQTGYQRVGSMRWHDVPTHQHWHFLDFARYNLLNADQTEVVRSRKQSWCLANTDQIDLTVAGAQWQPWNTDLGSACGGIEALSVREVLASGSGDTYAQFRAGQSFRLEGLPNGRYYVETVANPLGRLVESSQDNNVALRQIWLGGRPGHRRVLVQPVGVLP